MVNPAALMKLMSAKNKFEAAHPKMVSFFQRVFTSSMPVGTVIEITVTKPGEEPITANMKVQQSDLDLVEDLKSLSNS